jgi:preprotein translocase subunit SecB
MPSKKQSHTLALNADYTRFLKSIEPLGIAIVGSEFRVDRSRVFGNKTKHVSIAWGCKPIKIAEDYFEADAELTVKISERTAAKPVAEIRATFRMHLHAMKPINKDFVERFTDSEVRILVWPYFREYVTNVCGRMQIPPISLPLGMKE